jgi:predicted acetyltransferase
MEIRPVTAAEAEPFLRTTEAAFHSGFHADDLAMFASLFEPERSLAAVEDGEIVGTTGIYTRELTVPGAVVTAAGVTLVGVLPTHRRRGVLTALMRRQIDDVRAAGEAVAALWASEAAIYGRFGYGRAARHARITLQTGGARMTPSAPAPPGRMLLLDPEPAIGRIAPLYDRVRRERVGHLDRTEAWWKRRAADPEHRRDGRGPLRVALHEDDAGEADGYVLYAVRPGWSDGPDARVTVRELVADGPEATAAMWAFLLGLDLTRAVEWEIGPPDEPVGELVSGPQNARMELAENLRIRLVDVPAALTARAYAAPVDVVLEVEDAFCPWNAGRHRLTAAGDALGAGAATCEPTDAAPDIACSAEDLGAVYLGGTRLTALHAVGRVRELTPGAVARASTAFGAAREPWCPEIF